MEACQVEEIKKIRPITFIVAEKVGVTPAYVRMLINGKRRIKSKKSLLVATELRRISELIES